MREIIFRGKRKDDGEWVSGHNILKTNNEGGVYIVPTGQGLTGLAFDGSSLNVMMIPFNEVASETVGQFTGLTDKNGKQIFEGDIVKGRDRLEKNLEVYGYIDHKNGSFVIVGDIMTHYRWLDYEVEVIGNIHDNPELLNEEN